MNARIRRNLTAPAAAAVSTLIVLAWLAAPTAPASADSAQDAIRFTGRERRFLPLPRVGCTAPCPCRISRSHSR
jgi:hypothetical protein